jgi:hypothetical protein
MDRNHVYRAGIALGLFVATGCQAHKNMAKKPQAPEAITAPEEQVTQDTAAKSDAPPDNVDALTRKSEEYAKALEMLQNRKGGALPSTIAAPKQPVVAAAPKKDEVSWLDGGDRLSLYSNSPTSHRKSAEPETAPQALVKPAIAENTPTIPNQPTVAAPTGAAGPLPTAVAYLDPAKAALAPAPVPSASSATTTSSSALDERLGRLVKDYPKDVSAQFEYQLLQFLENQQVPQMQVLSALPAEDRELLTAIVDGLSNFRNTLRLDNNMLLSKKVRPILDLAERLRSQAELSIPTLVLCNKVDGFGTYEPVDPRFPANKDTTTGVYCEVENFSSQKNDKQLWETKLKQQVVLYTETGMQVWQAEPAVANEAVRTRRRDFFLVKLVTIPSTLPIGRYLMKVTVEDELAHRVAEASLPVLIVAQ